MSVPLDRLYNYLDSIIEDDIIIYRFFPHGSRKPEDLLPLYLYDRLSSYVNVICHDQEPMNYAAYGNEQCVRDLINHYKKLHTENWLTEQVDTWVDRYMQFLVDQNLKLAINPPNCFHKIVFLLHSERRSDNLVKYESNRFIGVYWWAHALISRDWFRFAEVDESLERRTESTTNFLIYNRAWAGTREYRLKFAELLVNNNIHNNCLTKFNPIDDGIYYKNHVSKNPKFSLGDIELENYFEKNTADSTASADYVSEDYQNTLIEVVLETLFDDERLHLTEKSLRPIACGQPFMLMATHGSLEYMRSYGFKTFAPYINEDYDTIVDPLERMSAIIVEMQRISSLPSVVKQKLHNNLKKISAKNKKLFFSMGFHNKLVDEYKVNFQSALEQSEQIMKRGFKSSYQRLSN